MRVNEPEERRVLYSTTEFSVYEDGGIYNPYNKPFTDIIYEISKNTAQITFERDLYKIWYRAKHKDVEDHLGKLEEEQKYLKQCCTRAGEELARYSFDWDGKEKNLVVQAMELNGKYGAAKKQLEEKTQECEELQAKADTCKYFVKLADHRSDKIEDLQQQIDLLKADSEKMSKGYAELTELVSPYIDDFTGYNEKLGGFDIVLCVKELLQQLDQLKTENDRLMVLKDETYFKLKEEYLQHLNQLKTENEELEKEVELLRQYRGSKQASYESMQVERNKAVSRNQDLLKQVENWQEKCNKLETENQKLKHDNGYEIGALERTIDNPEKEIDKFKRKEQECEVLALDARVANNHLQHRIEMCDLLSEKLKAKDQECEKLKEALIKIKEIAEPYYTLGSKGSPVSQILQKISETMPNEN